MACRTGKSIIYHIPKCGGTWVKRTFKRSMKKIGGYDKNGIYILRPYWDIKDNSSYQEFELKHEHATPSRIDDKEKDGLFSFCFVRHPVTWYKSFWCYRVKKGGIGPKFPLDKYCWDDSYEQFILNVLEKYPDGFVSQMVRYYDLDSMDFVGRQENLVDDLVTALSMASDEFDEDRLRNKRRDNEAAGVLVYGDKAVISEELEDRIIASEQWIIGEFYD